MATPDPNRGAGAVGTVRPDADQDTRTTSPVAEPGLWDADVRQLVIVARDRSGIETSQRAHPYRYRRRP